VVIVVPSWAVTTIVTVLLPTLSEIADVAEPEVAEVPLTVIVALAWVRVGVTVIEVTELATVEVYEVVAEANVGERVAVVKTSVDNVETVEAARVTVTV
jgi:hypothetical protein